MYQKDDLKIMLETLISDIKPKVKFLEEGYRKEPVRYPDGKYVDIMVFGQTNPYLN